VRVQEQVLAPGVENAGDADLRAQMPGIGRHFERSGGTGGEQQIVKAARVIKGQHIQFVRHGEDHVKVAGRKQFLLSCSEPAFARLSLALRTVSVAARIVGDGSVSASGTGIDMASEGSRTAALDGTKRLELLKAKARSILVEEAVALRAEDVGHLHGGPCHSVFLR